MKNALLLINLGTPQAPDKRSVRQYLAEFLADPRVIDLPAPLRYALIYCLVLPFRPKTTASAYQAIWTDEGSPLLSNSLKLKEKLQRRLQGTLQVELGMRYGKPSIQKALDSLSSCENLTILPLYPQYSSAATGSAIEKTLSLLRSQVNFPSLKIISSFYQEPAYLKAQAALIKPLLPHHDFILFSYHGVPVRQLKKAGCPQVCEGPCPSDNTNLQHCYRAQCHHSTEAIAKLLGLRPEQYGISFQSRLGKTPWIGPFTDKVLEDLAKKGIKRLAICCPSFVADCLETEEEIGIRGGAQWQQLTGETLTLVPCLNDDDLWVDALIEICELD